MKLPALVLPVLLWMLALPASGQEMNGFHLPPLTDLNAILAVLPDSVVAEIEQLPDSLLATLPDSVAAELSVLAGPERWHRVFAEASRRLLLAAPRDSARRWFVRASSATLGLEEAVSWDGASPLHPDSVYSRAPELEEAYIKAWLEANTPKFWTPEQQEQFRETFSDDVQRMNRVWQDSLQPIADSVKAAMERNSR